MRHTGESWATNGTFIVALLPGIGTMIIGQALRGKSSRKDISNAEAEANATLMGASLALFEKLHKLVEAVGVEDPRCLEAQELISTIVGERLK